MWGALAEVQNAVGELLGAGAVEGAVIADAFERLGLQGLAWVSLG